MTPTRRRRGCKGSRRRSVSAGSTGIQRTLTSWPQACATNSNSSATSSKRKKQACSSPSTKFTDAGLQNSEVSDLLNDDVLTFLRRADRHTLGAVAQGEVERAIRQTVESAGRIIHPAACARAAQSTGGYPFLIQLVGHHIWRQHPAENEITFEDLNAGVPAALRRMGSLVHETALKDLSHVDRTFLLAMAHDDGPSRLADIGARLGVLVRYSSVYRQRLIDAQMIHAAGHGLVEFSLPYMRDYLRDHGALETHLQITSGDPEVELSPSD